MAFIVPRLALAGLGSACPDCEHGLEGLLGGPAVEARAACRHHEAVPHAQHTQGRGLACTYRAYGHRVRVWQNWVLGPETDLLEHDPGGASCVEAPRVAPGTAMVGPASLLTLQEARVAVVQRGPLPIPRDGCSNRHSPPRQTPALTLHTSFLLSQPLAVDSQALKSRTDSKGATGSLPTTLMALESMRCLQHATWHSDRQAA